MASGELAGLLRSLKATLKLGPGNTKLVADALRHGLGSWPELASSGDGARAGASRECGRPFAAPQSGAAERHCHSPAIPPIRTRRRFGDAAPRRVGCRQCRTCPGHARARSSGRSAPSHGRFPLEPIRRAESHGNSTPETDGVWPRGCCVSRARRRRAATCQPPKSAAAAVTGFEANIAGIPKD